MALNELTRDRSAFRGAVMNTAVLEHQIDFVPVTYRESEAISPERRVRVAVTIRESEHLYLLDAKSPGFTVEELKIRAEPFRVFITGKKGSLGESSNGRRAGEICEAIDLSCEIDVRTVIAEWSDGVLSVSMRKIPFGGRVRSRKATSIVMRTHSAQLHKQADTAKRYSAAAKEQLRRATAWKERARERATEEQKKMKARWEPVLSQSLCERDARDFEPWTFGC